MSRPRLRTTTGCLRCRRRRKKCDEERPICGYCNRWDLACSWPESGLRGKQHENAGLESRPWPDDSEDTTSEPIFGVTNVDEAAEVLPRDATETPLPEDIALSLSSETLALQSLKSDLKTNVHRHFKAQFRQMMILPDSEFEFYDAWASTLDRLVNQLQCLEHAVLATAAAHLYYIHAVPLMQEFAFDSYALTIKKLLSLLRSADLRMEEHDGVLTTAVLLYSYGYTGCGTYAYASSHLVAAMQILKLRYFNDPISAMKPIDRVMIESVMFHISFFTLGCWSDTNPTKQVLDSEFWFRCEEVLDKTILFPGCPTSFNSPVLGVPYSLLRMALLAHELYRQPDQNHSAALGQIRNELAGWETAVRNDLNLDWPSTTIPAHYDNASISADAASLYVLVISILVNRMFTTPVGDDQQQIYLSTQSLTSHPNWQIWKALQILCRRRHDETWAAAYVGNWPVYALGYLVHSPETVRLVCDDMRHRWQLQRFAMVARYADDLKNVWSKSGYGHLVPRPMITIGSPP